MHTNLVLLILNTGVRQYHFLKKIKVIIIVTCKCKISKVRLGESASANISVNHKYKCITYV